MTIVERLSPDMSGDQRRFLRGLAHDLKPIVWVGQKGVSEALLENVDAALLSHELIKVKVHDKDDLDAAAEALCEGTGAQLPVVIGKTLILYRPHPESPKIQLPG